MKEAKRGELERKRRKGALNLVRAGKGATTPIFRAHSPLRTVYFVPPPQLKSEMDSPPISEPPPAQSSLKAKQPTKQPPSKQPPSKQPPSKQPPSKQPLSKQPPTQHLNKLHNRLGKFIICVSPPAFAATLPGQTSQLDKLRIFFEESLCGLITIFR
jgi:hypothetical protein